MRFGHRRIPLGAGSPGTKGRRHRTRVVGWEARSDTPSPAAVRAPEAGMSPSRMIESRRMIELAVIRSPARPGRHFARYRPTSMYRPRGVLRTSHPHGEFWRLTECRLLAPIAKWSTSERWPGAARKQKLQVRRRRPRISRYAPDGGRRADGAVLSAFLREHELALCSSIHRIVFPESLQRRRRRKSNLRLGRLGRAVGQPGDDFDRLVSNAARDGQLQPSRLISRRSAPVTT